MLGCCRGDRASPLVFGGLWPKLPVDLLGDSRIDPMGLEMAVSTLHKGDSLAVLFRRNPGYQDGGGFASPLGPRTEGDLVVPWLRVRGWREI